MASGIIAMRVLGLLYVCNKGSGLTTLTLQMYGRPEPTIHLNDLRLTRFLSVLHCILHLLTQHLVT